MRRTLDIPCQSLKCIFPGALTIEKKKIIINIKNANNFAKLIYKVVMTA